MESDEERSEDSEHEGADGESEKESNSETEEENDGSEETESLVDVPEQEDAPVTLLERIVGAATWEYIDNKYSMKIMQVRPTL